MDFEIRKFRAEDHTRAIRLWETCDGVGVGSSDSYERVAQFLERNPGLSLVALEGEVLVGTILCGHDGRRGSFITWRWRRRIGGAVSVAR